MRSATTLVRPLLLRPLLPAMLRLLLSSMVGLGLLVALASTAGVSSRRLLGRRGHAADLAALEVDVDAARVVLGRVVQAQLAADLLDAGLDLLDVARAVVALADDDVQVCLPPRARVPDPRLEDVLGLLDELPVQVDGVVGHPPRRVVLPENVLGRLLVVRLHLRRVPLALVA